MLRSLYTHTMSCSLVQRVEADERVRARDETGLSWTTLTSRRARSSERSCTICGCNARGHVGVMTEITLEVNGINCNGCKKSLTEAFTAANIEIISIATKADSGIHPNKVVVKAALDAATEAIAAADKGRGKFTIAESAHVHEHGHEHAGEHDHVHNGDCCGGGNEEMPARMKAAVEHSH